jgi:enhancer of polycomb-like protein
MRYGRGGRVFLDRRDPTPQRFAKLPRSSLFALGDEDESTLHGGAEEAESQKRLEELWRFDIDDMPPVGSDGAEEHDRQLIDDYDTGYVLYSFLGSDSLNIMQVLEALHDPPHRIRPYPSCHGPNPRCVQF